MDWVHVARIRHCWRAAVNTVMNFRFPYSGGNFLAIWGAVSLWERTPLFGINQLICSSVCVVSNGEVHSEWCAVIVRPAIRDAAVRTVTVFCCKDGRQIITNADSPTLCRRTACVNTVSHLTLSHRPRFRVTAISTLTWYLWMHVKLLYPPPTGLVSETRFI